MSKSFFEKIKDKKEQKAMDENERRKLEAARAREEEQDVRKRLFDTETQITEACNYFERLYVVELEKAKADKMLGKPQDPKKYNKIGIAFYCNQLLKAAKEKIQDQSDDYQLQLTLNGMINSLVAIRGLDKVIGTWDVKTLKKQVKSFGSSTSGMDAKLANTLEVLSRLNITNEDKTMIENLVSTDAINGWIDDEDLATECWRSGEGVEISTEQVIQQMSNDEKQLDDAIEDLETVLQGLR